VYQALKKCEHKQEGGLSVDRGGKRGKSDKEGPAQCKIFLAESILKYW